MMKRIMTKFWSITSKVIKWYMKTNKCGMPNGFCLTMGLYILIGMLVYHFEFLSEMMLVKMVMMLICIMILILCFFTEDKWVRKFSRNKYKTPIELLKSFSNGSYVYGVLFWLFTGEIWLYGILSLLVKWLIPITEFTIINVMTFTFLWFTYHLYMNNELGSEENKQAIIKLKLQLFAAVASTVSALLLVFDLGKAFKIMVTMLALIFTWLRYIIEAEIQSTKLGKKLEKGNKTIGRIL